MQQSGLQMYSDHLFSRVLTFVHIYTCSSQKKKKKKKVQLYVWRNQILFCATLHKSNILHKYPQAISTQLNLAVQQSTLTSLAFTSKKDRTRSPSLPRTSVILHQLLKAAQ